MPNKPIRFMTKRRVNQITQEEIQTVRNIQEVNNTRSIQKTHSSQILPSVPVSISDSHVDIENNLEIFDQNSDQSSHNCNEQMEEITENYYINEVKRPKTREYVVSSRNWVCFIDCID